MVPAARRGINEWRKPYLTPSAYAPMPLIFGPGHVTMKNTVRANLLFLVLSLVVMFAFIVPFVPVVLGG